jgi:hypothetical protein
MSIEVMPETREIIPLIRLGVNRFSKWQEYFAQRRKARKERINYFFKTKSKDVLGVIP